MAERKLASIQKIVSVEPIEGADKIELVRVLGWQCVTQKSNNFKPGMLVCYHEIDSLIPTNPPYDFLKKKPEDTEARLKTIRLKGKLSQGLVLPLDVAVSGLHQVKIHTTESPNAEGATLPPRIEWESGQGRLWLPLTEGTDLTEALGITKYEAPIPAQLRGLVKGQFPYFLTKTDETRIQSCPGVLERHKDKKVYITEKIDGSSVTFYYYTQAQAIEYGLPIKMDQADVFGVCSRNLDLENTEDNAYWKCALKYDIREKMRAFGQPLAIQGEMYGDGICGNVLKQPGLNFRMFNAYNIGTKSYGGYTYLMAVALQLELPLVPVLAIDVPLDYTVDQLVTYAIGKSALNPAIWREGIVVRTMEPDVDKDLGRWSFKTINPEYLLKYD